MTYTLRFLSKVEDDANRLAFAADLGRSFPLRCMT